MGHRPESNLAYGIYIKDLLGHGLCIEENVKEALAKKHDCSLYSFQNESPEEQQRYQDFQNEFNDLGITYIEGGSENHPDVSLVASECCLKTDWDQPLTFKELPPTPSDKTFKERLDKYLNLLPEEKFEYIDDSELELLNKTPQWIMMSYYG